MRNLLVNWLLADALFSSACAVGSHGITSTVFSSVGFVAWISALLISDALWTP